MGFYLLNGYTINAWFPRVAKDGILLGALIFLDIWKKQYENQSQIANITLKIKKKILTWYVGTGVKCSKAYNIVSLPEANFCINILLLQRLKQFTTLKMSKTSYYFQCNVEDISYTLLLCYLKLLLTFIEGSCKKGIGRDKQDSLS